MHRPTNTNNRGFTIIELLFAMTFLAVLLVLVLTAGLQLTRVYNKGITLKQVNQSGATLGTDLESSFKAAGKEIDPASASNGRLCLGSFSYVWNLKGATTNKYVDSSDPIGIVKVADATGAMCAGSSPQKSVSTELLEVPGTTGGTNLELRDFSVTEEATSGTNYVYNVAYTISTNDESLINASTNSCSGSADDSFCALNSFSFDVFVRNGGPQ